MSLGLLCLLPALGAASADDTLRALAEQNRRLEELVRSQQDTIATLSARMAELERSANRQGRDLRALQRQVDGSGGGATSAPGERGREVRVAGETGVAVFDSGARGAFPHAEWRLDDPVISLEAPVAPRTYFFGELRLLPRESNSEEPQLGEFYVDFEDISAHWGQPGRLSLRVGQINTPFGEEYLVRGPVANPLISHSLADVWGTDEGAEIYGRLGPAQYVLAVQNGGSSRLRDFHSDKAVVGRVGWDPEPWLHLSASAMRTGRMGLPGDKLTDIWFATGFFRSIGETATTSTFWASLYEVDASARWSRGHVTASYGVARYDDNDTRDNARRLRFGYLEMVQRVTERLYAAARYSGIRAPGGYPMAGGATMGEFFFRPVFTTKLDRLSVGLGYRFSPSLVWKVEYSWNGGRLLDGARRRQEDFLGSELGVRF